MTKRELSEYIDLSRECDDLRIRIHELEEEKECSIVQSSMEDFPYTRTRTPVYGNSNQNRKKIARMRRTLDKKLDEAEKARKRIEEFIDTIQDGQTRRVFRHKYLDGWTWARIGEVMGYEKSAPEKRVSRYLRKQKVSMDV